MAEMVGEEFGRFSLVLVVLVSVGEFVYILVLGWHPQTPMWGQVLGGGFPLAATFPFVWYLRRYHGHEDRELLFTYGGSYSMLLGVLWTTPGIGVTLQQQMVGQPLLNPEIFVMELWLGGCLVGLAIGHFYATSQAEQGRLEQRTAELTRHRQQLTVLNRVLRHDIRNQINVVLGAASQLTRPPEKESHAEKIIHSGQKIVELSENARHIESFVNQNQSTTCAVELTTLVADLVDRMRSKFPDAHVRVDLPHEAWVESNGHVDTAVQNLLENAIVHNDATPPEVRVTVSAASDPETVLIRIADNGPGIPEYEQMVFERKNETTLQHSNGLGLWLVYWITDDIDGELRIEDRHPRGTVTTLRVARASPEAEPEPPIQ